MNHKLNLALFFGGKSGEHSVSLQSAKSVFTALCPEKYEVFLVGISQDGRWKSAPNAIEAFCNDSWQTLPDATLINRDGQACLYTRSGDNLNFISRLDVIFPVLHGSYGEDGCMQGLFEVHDLAYVGSGVLGSSLAMDKALCKRVVESIGIPVAPYRLFTRHHIAEDLPATIQACEAISAYPLFVKPANLGSSVGISKVSRREDLQSALEYAARFDRRIIVEQGINAREIEISVMGNDRPLCSLPGEIVPGDSFYSFKDKYRSGDPTTHIPAPLSAEKTRLLQESACRAYQALDLAGMARVDFLLDKDSEQIFFNEANTIPGFTSISMYAKLWEASGLKYAELLDRLIGYALERKVERDATQRKYEE